jgi:hypothetical protein
MSDIDTRTATRPARPDRATPHEDTAPRRELEEKTLLAEERDASPTFADEDLEPLRQLVQTSTDGGAVFQSVAVAAVQILERAICYEEEAADAALSLGQQEKLDRMTATAREAVALLRGTLSAQGAKVMNLCSTEDALDSQPWWFALTDALEVLEEGTDRMESLTVAQPERSAARALSNVVTQLLRSHHDALLVEAEQWIA